MNAAPGDPAASGDLLVRTEALLAECRTMTVATVGVLGREADAAVGAAAAAAFPHAATVYFAVWSDSQDRPEGVVAPWPCLVFLSTRSSTHASHILAGSPVAVTVAPAVDDWRHIRGLQVWGDARALKGRRRAQALTRYVARFPFVAGLLKEPELARVVRELEVFLVTPERLALTDNRRRGEAAGDPGGTALFGREVLEFGS